MKKFILFLSFFCCLGSISSAANVDTISIYSDAMHKAYKCVVIKPAGYKKSKVEYPVVYLLHGYSGWYANWIIRVPDLKEQADKLQIMIVCPDGGFSSWYIDSPLDSAIRFETYVGLEIPAYIDAHYKTIKDRKARAITGLSMGGHGGLFLGFRHSDIFGACGSMSGGVDMRPFPKNWDISKRIGDSAFYADNWKNYSVINIVENKPKDSLAIIIDCGTEDFFYTVNKNLHQKLLQLKIPHDYIERPGQHNWDYWRNAVQYQLLFFKNYFEKMQK
ncbi:MAG TPA: alpha/beta hydrolase family protein [Chitinophagaceae bacterium]|nr:alpha/beta hydrolase family protein [Chitinophagaceae bacterium]